ncbi:hypothetical protein JG687_00018030 [Phytophthora cactorum]|uniref:uDENN domain-containing protein n=1 Tax=Phytophthora cactorum TaxID=29920 RepID=A0A8T1TQT1_9STRA|nr:hypothetical protein JG687_00018030 [Phytophthora cactorum]
MRPRAATSADAMARLADYFVEVVAEPAESVAFFNPTVYERKPTFFSFILTGGDGAHAYGFALHFFEEYTTSASDWRPRVLCLISHHPFFSLFKEIVR